MQCNHEEVYTVNLQANEVFTRDPVFWSYPLALVWIIGCTNAVISGKVVQTVDCGTHTLFIAEVTEAKVLENSPSVTYQYYFDHIKPKPQIPAGGEQESWVCKVCSYVHEGPLPEGFICPWCKHGAEDFVRQK